MGASLPVGRCWSRGERMCGALVRHARTAGSETNWISADISLLRPVLSTVAIVQGPGVKETIQGQVECVVPAVERVLCTITVDNQVHPGATQDISAIKMAEETATPLAFTRLQHCVRLH
jgi:hypothetical protein